MTQRHRIVHLLGRGGMGEVYRADDLLLGQPVALKFLPRGATASASAVSRFLNEVRTARQISHPNVCRVYDIGEAEGLTYLSMEYVDGEDLASLLRRIGKLPQEKALEIARQMCAGVAAAHDKNVIHRDLKPANIMLDGKGQVRITDFGIAGVAEQIRDARSGTPAYMSPEQLAGKEVTARSDIYALGIVLCELLTGKRPPLEANSAGMDPVVERVIQRCLEPDPQMRPGSVLSVAAALPGGDPLAAALARGDTPAPEVVANAGPVEGLRPWVAVTFLAALIVGLGFLCVLRQRQDLINQIPMENSPEVYATLLSLLLWLLLLMIPGGLGCSLLMSLISIAVQRRWLAAALFVVLMTLIMTPSYGRPSLLTTTRLLIIQTVVVFPLIRFGVLATVATLYAAFVIEVFPLATNGSAWYAPDALLGIATLVALALYGFVTTLSARRQRPANADVSL